MQTLIEYEKNERYLATKLFSHIPTIKNYTFSEGKVCYDTIITLENGNIILGEIKVRNCFIDSYAGFILQVDKLINLIKRMQANKYQKIYYINFFFNKKDGLKDFVVFNISARIDKWKLEKPKVELMWMNEVTCRSNKKVQKEVILLNIDKDMDWTGTMTI